MVRGGFASAREFDLEAGALLWDSWQPRQPRYSRGIRLAKLRIVCNARCRSSSNWKWSEMPEGAWKATEPSASTGTVPSRRCGASAWLGFVPLRRVASRSRLFKLRPLFGLPALALHLCSEGHRTGWRSGILASGSLFAPSGMAAPRPHPPLDLLEAVQPQSPPWAAHRAFFIYPQATHGILCA